MCTEHDTPQGWICLQSLKEGKVTRNKEFTLKKNMIED